MLKYGLAVSCKPLTDAEFNFMSLLFPHIALESSARRRLSYPEMNWEKDLIDSRTGFNWYFDSRTERKIAMQMFKEMLHPEIASLFTFKRIKSESAKEHVFFRRKSAM